ncbi:MAG TPA: MarC family protein [Terriglobales bacterium]|nr:MarC family protein [Terriglobales bacterium]
MSSLALMSINAEVAFKHVLQDLPTASLATFLALFPIVNPFGGIPLFFSLTADFSYEERCRTARKTAFYVIAILVVFMLFGRFVLNFFGISLPVLKIAGGLIVANTAWGMVTGSSRMTHEENSEALTKEDISLTPMAMPMLSGPGSIGVVMGLAAHADNFLGYAGMILGILAIGLAVYLFLRLGGPLVKQLGPGAMGAISRIFGFLILAIAVQLVWDGVADFRG